MSSRIDKGLTSAVAEELELALRMMKGRQTSTVPANSAQQLKTGSGWLFGPLRESVGILSPA